MAKSTRARKNAPSPTLMRIVKTLPYPQSPRRHWELDALRGVAILAMISFHFLFDLKYFGTHPSLKDIQNLPEVFWDVYSGIIAVSFLLLVGISGSLRAKNKNTTLATFKTPAFRALGAAGLVTMISLIFDPELPIYFGVLHCIGVSLFLLPGFLKIRGRAQVALALSILVMGNLLSLVPVGFRSLIWLGLKPTPMPMGDYFPLLPWVGVVFLGALLERALKLADRPVWFLPAWAHSKTASALSFLGRHSLLIYLVHQPIVLALTSLIGLTRFPH